MRLSSLKTKIITSKLVETRDFYISCLGLQVVEEWSEEDDVGCILALPRGRREALLEIYHGPQPSDFSGVGLQFRTEDLGAFRASLPAGAEASEPIKRPWGSTYVYLTDPNGIAVVVFEGGL
jgi:catechol 2,3-dioxygenase-like lactoylglutathione lyase family enzyme